MKLAHILVPVALLLAQGMAVAQPFEHRDRVVLDARYHHDHYYPATGHVVVGLPGGAVSVGFGGSHYWYHGGVWYEPYGASFRVIVPPFGVVVPVLPDAYVTLAYGGVPYYYANGVYYNSAPGGYVVVAPPPNADSLQPTTPPPPPAPVVMTPAAPATPPTPIIYPRNGQSPQQQEADLQACNRWATTQPAAVNDASIFQRSVAACMDGHGYSMR